MGTLKRPRPSRPLTILCVDDEAVGLSIRKTVLEHAGYAVLTAESAAEALEIFAANRIDLVVSDHLLPDDTGTRMAGQMKLAKPGIPILLLSGLIEPPEGTEHADKFLAKTEGPKKLLETIAEMLRCRRLRIGEGPYSADIVCDSPNPAVWHYVIQRAGSAEIVSWTYATSEEAAVAAASKQLSFLNRKRSAASEES